MNGRVSMDNMNKCPSLKSQSQLFCSLGTCWKDLSPSVRSDSASKHSLDPQRENSFYFKTFWIKKYIYIFFLFIDLWVSQDNDVYENFNAGERSSFNMVFLAVNSQIIKKVPEGNQWSAENKPRNSNLAPCQVPGSFQSSTEHHGLTYKSFCIEGRHLCVWPELLFLPK